MEIDEQENHQTNERIQVCFFENKSKQVWSRIKGEILNAQNV